MTDVRPPWRREEDGEDRVSSRSAADLAAAFSPRLRDRARAFVRNTQPCLDMVTVDGLGIAAARRTVVLVVGDRDPVLGLCFEFRRALNDERFEGRWHVRSQWEGLTDPGVGHAVLALCCTFHRTADQRMARLPFATRRWLIDPVPFASQIAAAQTRQVSLVKGPLESGRGRLAHDYVGRFGLPVARPEPDSIILAAVVRVLSGRAESTTGT